MEAGAFGHSKYIWGSGRVYLDTGSKFNDGAETSKTARKAIILHTPHRAIFRL